MKLIEQEETCGCSIACIAMVTGKTYQEVRKDWTHDFEKDGVDLKATMDYLGDAGFAIVHKRLFCYIDKDNGRQELLKPFAPMHILNVKMTFDSPHSHVVVMDEKGKIYCPGGFSEKEIRNCYGVTDAIGLYK